MAIDGAAARALVFAPIEHRVDRARLQFFAETIGETAPEYVDVVAARAAGHPDLPVPPTYLFGIELDRPDPFAYLAELGVDLRHVLHGDQAFAYHAPAFAGDVLTVTTEIVDTYVKAGGALDFLVKEATVRRDDALVAVLSSTIVVRNPGGV